MKIYIRPLIFVMIILAVSYNFGWIFFFRFEPEYWENYYYHSQYNIPNSTRKMADGEVYRYVGYKLVNGENPFNIDYWVPPLGKYLYGLTAKFLNNPYWTSYAFYLLGVIIFRLIAKKFLREQNASWLASYAYALNPLIISQVGATMLDLPQSVWFLIHILFLFNNKIGLAGFFLGLMAGTKIAYFIPAILLADWFYVGIKFNFRKGFWLLFGLISGYVSSYFCYFIRHPNPIPWIRLHKKIIDFWMQGTNRSLSVNQFLFIFFNYFRGRFTHEWSLWMPIGLVSLGYSLVKIKKILKENKELGYLSILGGSLVVLMIMIDFWPRYWVVIMPVVILIISALLYNRIKILILLVLSILPWLIPIFWSNSKSLQEEFARQITIDGYREMYRLISQEDRLKIDEKTWQEKWHKVKKETLSSLIKAEVNNGKLTLNYQTRIGVISLVAKLKTIKEHNRWVMLWDWEYLLPQFTGSEEIKNELDPSVTSVYDQNGKKLAETAEWPMIWVVPRETYNVNELIDSLNKVSCLSPEENQAKFYSVVPDIYPVEIGWVKSGVIESDLTKLAMINSVRIEYRQRLVLDDALKKTEVSGNFDGILKENRFRPSGKIYIHGNEKEVLLINNGINQEETVIIKNLSEERLSGNFSSPRLKEFRPLVD